MKPLPIAVLISGGGTTLENLIQRQLDGQLPVEFKLVVSSNPNSRGLQLAEQASIPSVVISRRDFEAADAHREAVFAEIRRHGVELVVMGGYLQHLLIPTDYENRVVNIHPSLIPAFAGKGFYGLRVHQAVLDQGAKLTGCTTHFVDDHFDHGPIIAQRACEVLDDDTAETLQRRVFELECDLLPDTIAAIASGDIRVQADRVRGLVRRP